jgi:hypothetical protein
MQAPLSPAWRSRATLLRLRINNSPPIERSIDDEKISLLVGGSGSVPGGNFQDAVARGIAYVKEAGVDAVWMNTMTEREQIAEACRRIPAPVIAPYYGPRPSPTFEEFQKPGAAAVLYPSLTTANGLQSIWEILHEFKERGPAALDEWNKKATASKYGMVPRTQDPILPSKKIIKLEDDFIPKELQRDYGKTFGHNRH